MRKFCFGPVLTFVNPLAAVLPTVAPGVVDCEVLVPVFSMKPGNPPPEVVVSELVLPGKADAMVVLT